MKAAYLSKINSPLNFDKITHGNLKSGQVLTKFHIPEYVKSNFEIFGGRDNKICPTFTRP